jgi:C1A family cysteine protease
MPRTRGRIDPPNLAERHREHAARHAAAYERLRAIKDLPPSLDLRLYCTPIKDQGGCGSCWDFSGTAMVESAAIAAGYLPDNSAASQLSEQYTLDQCDSSNGGCAGDDNTTVLADAKNGGLPLTSYYGPYAGRAEACRIGLPRKRRAVVSADLYPLADWGYVGTEPGVPPVQVIKAALTQYGPIGAAVAADNAFEAWGETSPQLAKPFKGSGSTAIDHDVVIVGWTDATNSWLVRNSWGTSWGAAGYIAIDYAANQIGYEAVWCKAAPPIPAPSPPTPPAPPQPQPWCHPKAAPLLRLMLRSTRSILELLDS